MSSSSTDTKDIRKFGTVALVFFGALGAVGWWLGKPLPTYLFGFLSLMGLGFLTAPSLLRPVYAFWLKIARLLGRVVTAVILTVAYYLVITPSALIKRVFGGRPLPTRSDKNAASYWVPRTEPVQPKERFLKRY